MCSPFVGVIITMTLFSTKLFYVEVSVHVYGQSRYGLWFMVLGKSVWAGPILTNGKTVGFMVYGFAKKVFGQSLKSIKFIV